MNGSTTNVLDADDTASHTLPGISGCQGQRAVAFAEIIFAGMNDYAPS